MGNILNDEKKQQVLALGRLGWSLRRIEKETGVRRETVSGYLKAAGIALRPQGSWGRQPASKPANEVTTDPGADKSDGDAVTSKPANGVTTDFGGESAIKPEPVRATSASASECEPFRDLIESALSRGRNATAIWQDLVDQNGFRDGYQSVKRFIRKLRRARTPEACGIIVTAAGQSPKNRPDIYTWSSHFSSISVDARSAS